MAKPPSFKVKTDDDLDTLLRALISDLASAHDHLMLLKALNAAGVQADSEMHSSMFFWQLTHQSHAVAGIMSLAKAFDDNEKTVSLGNLLQVMRDNPAWFERAAFKNRLRDNKFAETLAERSTSLDLKQLEADIAFVMEDPIVKRLRLWRHNVIAHNSPDYARKPKETMERWQFTIDELLQLTNKGFDLFNSYNLIFKAEVFSRNAPDRDDYQRVLDAVRFATERPGESDAASELSRQRRRAISDDAAEDWESS